MSLCGPTLSQPHAGATPIFLDEFYAARLKRGADLLSRIFSTA
jgi:hypothetical protein